MKLTQLYESHDLVPDCYGNKPGQYCDPKGKAKTVGTGDMSFHTTGTKGRDKFINKLNKGKKKKSKK
jgi:hypothetical protein